MEEKTEEQLEAEFIDEYKKLCDKRGFQIVVVPIYKARDDSTWSTVLHISAGRIPQQNG